MRYTGSELCALSAVQAVKLLRNKDISPKELLEAAFARIKQVEGDVNALPILCKDRALKAMKNKDFTETKLCGLPIPIKDLSNVAGVVTTCGTPGLANVTAPKSDQVVLHIEKNGGVIYAKSNTPEFGAGANTFNSVFGKTRNPYDTSRNAGGSSGGAAVSLATGTSWLAHGSDLAGSLRTPAAYCGVVGLRPSPGLVVSGGGLNQFETDGLQGPMARSVEDCALFLDAMVGFDPHYAISFPAPKKSFLQSCKQKIKPRIAFAPTLGGFGTNTPEMTAHLTAQMNVLAKNDARVEESCPELPGLNQAYRVIRGILWASHLGNVSKNISQHFKDTLRQNIDFGMNLSIHDYFAAQTARANLFEVVTRHLDNFDVLACPVVGVSQRLVEEEYPKEINGEKVTDYIEWLRYSFLSTVTGLPAISVPFGFIGGMPVGIQLIGRHRGEALLLQVAKFIENVMGGANKPIDPNVTHH